MDNLELNVDVPLTEFINDYAEETLSPVELKALLEYFDHNPAMASFAEKSRQGRRRLKHAYRVKAAPDFEEKLARSICQIDHSILK